MIFVFMLVIIIAATIGLGVYYYFQPSVEEANRKIKVVLSANVISFVVVLLGGTISVFSGATFGATAAAATTTATNSSAGLGYIAAALSTGLATIGTGYAVGSVGSSALGAVSENPKILGKTMIFVGLAEGIAIYGLIISILILGKL
ncbi:ATP synthase subunit C [Fusibacter bizertensis]|jgi:ATP synthase subunit C.|uniref:ATP synthase subunit C n=1 Tax=Fusibacter bizertensis TaxID=1488331 RepID=A0ABT6NFY0_9FIRM|nr:ATP synthase subunit C [Fusibacter bizertensis]MDH8679321.1 ATP synthase subunit C [Fusibacter bizertensis]